MKIAITGGASAGHVVPALAVADELATFGAQLVFIGRGGSIESEYAERAGLPFRAVPAAGLKRHRSWGNLLMPLTVLRGVAAAWRVMRLERPDALFSKGSYVSVPVGMAAWLCKVPIVIHESDRSLGLANRILARLAETVCFSTPPAPTTPRWLSAKAAVTGLPLRSDLTTADPDGLRERLGVTGSARVLLAFCGSSGSQRVNQAVRAQLDALCDQYAVLHVCGKGNLDPSLEGRAGYWQVEYLHEDMNDALHLADTVIGRAGATTLAELEALAIPAVLVPLPTSVSRGDQIENAAAYAERNPGRCIVVADEALTDGKPLVEACERLREAPREADPGTVAHHAREAAGQVARLTLAVARSALVRR
ncbi:UDP-N-acetylglucosamine--N-acetylmuramyl-(pentapeptide) pyrophosphoryl-undecaprenol N-acetylglucosamine transferase [Streptomyces sp. IBSNAI002]|uniref:UDP-N-acetylglucosamine--N-acetylmuramyl- (pentapeptide) pyrophosphoryl-undecaprenol N-acetylglucosamine transferase n=1 Tax=Streptomyces sp. IBSNAI002 TaxID=3457500 RepID=UPI003FD228B9